MDASTKLNDSRFTVDDVKHDTALMKLLKSCAFVRANVTRFASAAERHYQCLRAPIHTQRCEHVSMWKDSVRSASSLTVAIFKYLIRLACLFTFMKGVNQNP